MNKSCVNLDVLNEKYVVFNCGCYTFTICISMYIM